MGPSINHLATIISAFVAYAASFVWFAILFRKPYIAGLGKPQAELDRGPSMAAASIMQIIGFLVMAYAIAWFVAQLGQPSLRAGLTIALVAWLGFVAAVIVPMHAFQAFTLGFSAIVIGGYLVALLIIGAIIGAWR